MSRHIHDMIHNKQGQIKTLSLTLQLQDCGSGYTVTEPNRYTNTIQEC